MGVSGKWWKRRVASECCPVCFCSFFLEKNMQSYFLKTLSQQCGRYVVLQLLQTLSILFENIRNKTSICEYCCMLLSIADYLGSLICCVLSYMYVPSNSLLHLLLLHWPTVGTHELVLWFIVHFIVVISFQFQDLHTPPFLAELALTHS